MSVYVHERIDILAGSTGALGDARLGAFRSLLVPAFAQPEESPTGQVFLFEDVRTLQNAEELILLPSRMSALGIRD